VGFARGAAAHGVPGVQPPITGNVEQLTAGVGGGAGTVVPDGWGVGLEPWPFEGAVVGVGVFAGVGDGDGGTGIPIWRHTAASAS
jgi:hypothetical protein